jgi:membrane protein YqaA with SNARE-associated domain
MKIFSRLYDMALKWAAHRHAPKYLGLLSFAEASFFPVPPDVMLAPMVLAQRNKAWSYAGITSLASVFGGVFGYLIGLYAFELVEPLLHRVGYWDEYLVIRAWFEHWGFWAVFLAGFTFIPYKLFTIAAGVTGMFFPAFFIASASSRSARFYLVAAAVFWGGERMEHSLRKYADLLGWAILVLAAALYLIFR